MGDSRRLPAIGSGPTNICHPCVITHPGHRSRGCGAAVVSAVVESALAAGERMILSHAGSQSRVGRYRRAALGFEQHAPAAGRALAALAE